MATSYLKPDLFRDEQRPVAPDRKSTPPFAALRAFEAVGRLGGVRRAALSLGLDHAVVSRHVRWLEAWSGVQLLDRQHSGGRLTAEGSTYHSRISSALAEIANASAELTRSNGQSLLNIWCIPGFASQWLLTRLGRFRDAHPAFEVEIHPTDSPPDFASREADADLRFIRMPHLDDPRPGAHSIEIARPLMFPVASPGLMGKLGSLTGVDSLKRVPLLHEADQEEWKAWFESNGVPVTRPLPGPRLWHAHLTLGAAARGEGVALANPFLLGDELASGRLVRIPVGSPTVLGAYTFFCRKDRWQFPGMMQFRHWLVNLARTTTRGPEPSVTVPACVS
jgi:LysR family transcriptional regulator, glycine cleavage system transcriptional activator